MQPDSLKYLEDIRDAAAFVFEGTRNIDLSQYLDNRLLRQAAERNFEIIVEALNGPRHTDPVTADHIGDTPRIIAFRNVLAHGYYTIDHEIVRHLIPQNLPEHLQTVEHLLKEGSGSVTAQKRLPES